MQPDAPSFAYFVKGEYNDGIHNGWFRTDKSCTGSIADTPSTSSGQTLAKNARMGHPQ